MKSSLGFRFSFVKFHCSFSSKPTEKPKELIIPLIQKNRWHKSDQVAVAAAQTEEKSSKPQEATQDADSVDSQAVRELIEGM